MDLMLTYFEFFFWHLFFHQTLCFHASAQIITIYVVTLNCLSVHFATLRLRAALRLRNEGSCLEAYFIRRPHVFLQPNCYEIITFIYHFYYSMIIFVQINYWFTTKSLVNVILVTPLYISPIRLLVIHYVFINKNIKAWHIECNNA